MPQLALPPPALEDTGIEPKEAPLCSPYVQVPTPGLNPAQIKRLQQERLCHWLNQNHYLNEVYRIKNCGQNFVHLKCPNGHEKYVRMHCNREHCPTCGQKGSRLHKKRTTRAMDRLVWAPILGYLVFTLPNEISQSRPDLDVIKTLSKKAWDIIKQYFDTPGSMVRTHLMGERPGKFHIHINVLFPVLNDTGRGMVEQATLDIIKLEWTDYLNRFFKTSYENTNVYYKFATTKHQIRHKIRYVVRPIVNSHQFEAMNDKGRHYVLSFKGWHNTRWFGKLANCEYKKFLTSKGINPKKYEDSDLHLSRSCPACRQRYNYIDIIHKNNLPKNQLRWISTDALVCNLTFIYLKSKDG